MIGEGEAYTKLNVEFLVLICAGVRLETGVVRRLMQGANFVRIAGRSSCLDRFRTALQRCYMI